MKSSIKIFPFVLLAIVTFLSSCSREDDEPALAQLPISRLYVSFSEYQLDNAQAKIKNLDVIDPADSTKSFPNIYSFESSAKGGATVVFNPIAKLVFQSSSNGTGFVSDTVVQVMTVDPLRGSVSPRSVIANRVLTNVKGLAYHYNNGSDNLYVSNIGTPSQIYLFQKPTNFGGFAKYKQRIVLDADIQPWTMAFNDRDLLMAITGTKKGIAVFSDILGKTPEQDSVLETSEYKAKAILSIQDHGEVRGFNYSAKQDLLAVACYKKITETSSEGAILLFEKASTLLKGDTQTITPTRVITGALTGLKRPMDVAIDNRTGGKYLYVADSEAKRVSRFLFSESGNIVPDHFKDYTLTPVSISLDSRGPGE